MGRNGNDNYTEPLGLPAGHCWPQYSVHRGQLQMLMLRTVRERLGPQAGGCVSASCATAT